MAIKQTRNPVVINGMYRSGTSIFWRILSSDPVYKYRFYEPLHEELPVLSEQHAAMKSIREIPEIMEYWSHKFNYEKIKMGREEKFPLLKQYLEKILVNNSITKFTRIGLRCSWIRDRFPEVFFINLIRDPRAVCHSYLRRASKEYFLEGISDYKDIIRRIQYLIKYDKRFLPISFGIDFLKQRGRFATKKRKCHSIYCYQEYLDLLKDDSDWADAVEYSRTKFPPIRILILWKINTIQMLKDMQTIPGNMQITIRFEDFVEKPKKTIEEIYRKANFLEVPSEIINEVYHDSSKLENIGTTHHYDKKITKDMIHKWKKYDRSLWREHLEEAQIIDLMKFLGYTP
ncbi:MAG: hypothetical protein GF411_16290 [Candidatus Lokiarchaeota archaeon]|nr:hypothetical protein [Candidatus Lokiarchaeota archaeon]